MIKIDIIEPLKKHQATVLFLHGLGGNGTDYFNQFKGILIFNFFFLQQ
jgi:predicted esterase